MLFTRHRLSLPGIFMMTLILLFAYRNAEPSQLAIWTSIVCLNSIVQWYCIHCYFLNPTRFNGYVWARLLAVSSGMLGFVLGISACFFLDLSNGTSVLLATLFLISPIFGSTVFAAPYFPVHITWSLGSTMPLAWYFIHSGVMDYLVLGFSIVLAGIPAALVLGWILAGEYKRGLQASIENMRLIAELRHEKGLVEKTSKDKSRFLAAVSHDLRQPLHALDLFHSSLKSKMGSKDSRNLLGMAVQSSHALGEMLGELMDIARLDADKIVPNRSLVPLAPLLSDCIEEQRPLAKEKGLSLRYRSPLKGCVNSDPVLLKRILRNLLSNAIRHTESGGALLGTRMRGGAILVEVYDTGSGIEANELPHIFDEFYQVNNPERDREKGLGLGLSIVRRMASMLDHHVSVNSRPGRGTRFSLALPLCVAVKQCEPLAQLPKTEMHDLIGLFVLVVDDDRAILQGMRALLLGWGCEVLLAEGEDELMVELTAHDYPRPDLVISDYRLRGERTGLELVARVRHHFNDAKLPSVIISGDVHPDVQQQVATASCRWLEKPVAEADMKRLLASTAETAA